MTSKEPFKLIIKVGFRECCLFMYRRFDSFLLLSHKKIRTYVPQDGKLYALIFYKSIIVVALDLIAM